MLLKSKLIQLSILLLAITAFTVQSQEVVDYAGFRASYLFSYKTEAQQSEFAETDLMFLDIGEKVSAFYSRPQQIRDSVSTAGIRQGLSPHEVAENMRRYRRGVRTIIYSFKEENSFHVTEHLILNFLYKEPRTRPMWHIDNQTKEIAGYRAQRATAHYLGRNWIVYFSTEIPVSKGPWKLWGLPGLILEATDEDNYFNFRLNGFESVDKNIPISYITATATGTQFQQVEKDAVQRMQRLFHADTVEFARQIVMGGEGTVSMTPEQEENNRRRVASGGNPFIPLEPWN